MKLTTCSLFVLAFEALAAASSAPIVVNEKAITDAHGRPWWKGPLRPVEEIDEPPRGRDPRPRRPYRPNGRVPVPQNRPGPASAAEEGSEGGSEVGTEVSSGTSSGTGSEVGSELSEPVTEIGPETIGGGEAAAAGTGEIATEGSLAAEGGLAAEAIGGGAGGALASDSIADVAANGVPLRPVSSAPLPEIKPLYTADELLGPETVGSSVEAATVAGDAGALGAADGAVLGAGAGELGAEVGALGIGVAGVEAVGEATAVAGTAVAGTALVAPEIAGGICAGLLTAAYIIAPLALLALGIWGIVELATRDLADLCKLFGTCPGGGYSDYGRVRRTASLSLQIDWTGPLTDKEVETLANPNSEAYLLQSHMTGRKIFDTQGQETLHFEKPREEDRKWVGETALVAYDHADRSIDVNGKNMGSVNFAGVTLPDHLKHHGPIAAVHDGTNAQFWIPVNPAIGDTRKQRRDVQAKIEAWNHDLNNTIGRFAHKITSEAAGALSRLGAEAFLTHLWDVYMQEGHIPASIGSKLAAY